MSQQKFTFGTPTTTASAPGFSFNTQTPAAGGFGLGTVGQTSAQTGLQGSTQTTPGLNFSFGTTPAGTTATGQPTLTLGGGLGTGSNFLSTPQQQTATQLGQSQLGQTLQQGQQPAQTAGLTFGTPTAKPAGLTFGTPTTQTTGLSGGLTGLSTGTGLTTGNLTTASLTTGGLTAPSLTSGTSASGAATTGSLATGGLTSGGLTTGGLTTGGLTFGTPLTTGGLTFSTSTAGAITGGLGNLGGTSTAGGLTFGTTTSNAAATSTTLSFGLTATTSAPSIFGTGTTTTGLFGGPPPATTAAATTTASTNRGLGGLDVSIANKGLVQGSASPTAAKENLLPNELMQTIDGFKEFVKTQKVLSSDIARGSARPLNRCAEDTASLMEILTTLAGSVQRDRLLADKLKQDTAKALQNAEIAQRTHDTPSGLQYENTAPLMLFMELAENFENDLMLFKSQIESTEKHIQTMMTPKVLTPQELTMAMNKLHESLVAVAGRLQGVHSKVEQQKEQYLNFRKYVLKDSSNVFEDIKADGKTNRNSIGKVTSGPTPFGPGNRSFLSSSTLTSVQTPNYGSQNPLASWGNATTVAPTSFSMGTTMKPPTTALNFNPPANLTAPLSSTDPNSNFQLQKPPIGNKRGKH